MCSLSRLNRTRANLLLKSGTTRNSLNSPGPLISFDVLMLYNGELEPEHHRVGNRGWCVFCGQSLSVWACEMLVRDPGPRTLNWFEFQDHNLHCVAATIKLPKYAGWVRFQMMRWWSLSDKWGPVFISPLSPDVSSHRVCQHLAPAARYNCRERFTLKLTTGWKNGFE